MAEHADGSIIVDTEIDSSGFKSGSAELKSAINSLSKKVSGLGPTMQKAVSGSTKAMDTFEAKASAVQSTITELESKLGNLGHARLPTEDYKFFAQELQKAEQQLDKLEGRFIKMSELGVNKKSSAFKSLQYDIEQTKLRIDDLKATMAGMEQNGTAFQMGSATPEYQKMAADLAEAKRQMAEMNEQASQIPTKASRISAAFSKVGAIIKTSVVKGIKKAASAAKSLLTYTLKAALGMTKLGRSADKAGRRMGSFMGMMRSMLFFTAFSAVLRSLKEGIDSLAKASSEFNATMSKLKTSTSQLRNSLVTAFAPIMSMIIPWLSALISKLATAINLIGQFFAALSGRRTYTKAISKQEDYAASLEATGGAAKEAKRQLAGFDELNVLQDNDTGGGGAGDIQYEEIPINEDISDFVNRIKEAYANGDYAEIGKIIGEKLNEVFATIRDYISWDRVGDTIAHYVNMFCEIFNSLVDTIDWELIGDTFATGINTLIYTARLLLTGIDWGNLGKSFAEGLNGLIHGVDWVALGETIGHYFQANLDLVYNAITTFDWAGAGKALGDCIMTMISTVDWAKLGAVISEAFIGVLSFIKEAIRAIDWYEVGKAIGQALSSIDWGAVFAELGSILIEVFKGMFDGLAGVIAGDGLGILLAGFGLLAGKLVASLAGEFFRGPVKQALTSMVADMLKAMIGSGGIGGWAPALLTAGKGVVTTVIAKIGTLFTTILPAILAKLGTIISGIVAAIGGWPTLIIAAAAVGLALLIGWFMNGGKDVVNGFLQGCGEVMSNIGEWIKTHIVDPFVNFFKTLFGIHSPSTVMAELGTFLIQGLLLGLQEAWVSVIEWITEAFNTITTNVTTWATNVKTEFTTWATNVGNTMSQWATNTMNTVTTWVTNVKARFASWASETAARVSSWASTIQNKISTCASNLYSTISSKVSAIRSTVASGFEAAKNSMVSKMQSARSTIMGQDWYGVGTNICKGIANGLKAGWTSLKELVANIGRGLLLTAKNILGIHSPSRVFHDVIGLNIGYGIGEGIEDSEGSILDSVAGVAKAIEHEMAAGDYTVGNIVPSSEVDVALTSFSDKIADSFIMLLDRLQAIAGSVAFTAPSVAYGATPYHTAAQSYDSGSGHKSASEAFFDELAAALADMVGSNTAGFEAVVQAIQDKDMSVFIGDDTIGKAAERYNRRMAFVKGG